MDTIIKKAYAKLNLTLGVLYKRTDGYHALDTIMAQTDLYDEVTIEKAGDVLVTGGGRLLPYDNTLRRAAEKYRALTGHGAHIRIQKNVPAQAGMGGGSGDGAAVLAGMEQLYGQELDRRTLYELALSIGADVPFCLHGGLCRAEGIGELLTPIWGPELWFGILKPDQGVSTKALFSALPLPRKKPDTLGAIQALSKGDLPALGKLLYNALEEPAVALVPEIGRLKQALLEAGAFGAVMSGSGSAVFGLFGSQEAAKAAVENVSGAAYCAITRYRGSSPMKTGNEA